MLVSNFGTIHIVNKVNAIHLILRMINSFNYLAYKNGDTRFDLIHLKEYIVFHIRIKQEKLKIPTKSEFLGLDGLCCGLILTI